MELSILLFLFLPAMSFSKRHKTKRSLNSSHLCFPVVGDIGGVPYPPFQTPSQKDVAALLAKVTSQLNCQFVLGVGDNFYFDGVSNVSDPRFTLTFEQTYSNMKEIPWYMIAGNHDHLKNVSAQIGYSKVSKRWKFPFFYYSEVHSIPDSNKTAEIVSIDTTLLCWNKRVNGAPTHQEQMKWIEKKLSDSKSAYLIVAGHHPVLSGGLHGSTDCLIRKIKPLLEKHKVTAYFSGHDHNLQHIKEGNSDVHYFVTGSGNFVDGRMWNKDKLPSGSLKFQNGFLGGFTLLRLSDKYMRVTLLNTTPKELWKLKIFPRMEKKRNTTTENKTETSKQPVDNTDAIIESWGNAYASSLLSPSHSALPSQNLPKQNLPSQTLPSQNLLLQKLPSQHLPSQNFPSQGLLSGVPGYASSTLNPYYYGMGWYGANGMYPAYNYPFVTSFGAAKLASKNNNYGFLNTAVKKDIQGRYPPSYLSMNNYLNDLDEAFNLPFSH